MPIHYIGAMKHIIAAIALLAVTVPALAQPDPRTQEHRMWAAERMIHRLIIRLGKMNTVWQTPGSQKPARSSVAGLYPQFKIIREVAAGGDDVKWAKVIDIVHDLERDTDPALNALHAVEGK